MIGMRRTAKKDARLGDQAIKAGDIRVVMVTFAAPAANRDPAEVRAA